MSCGSIRKTSLMSPSVSATTKKVRSVESTGWRRIATAISPSITAGLAAYSSPRREAATAIQSASANNAVTASASHAKPVIGLPVQ